MNFSTTQSNLNTNDPLYWIQACKTIVMKYMVDENEVEKILALFQRNDQSTKNDAKEIMTHLYKLWLMSWLIDYKSSQWMNQLNGWIWSLWLNPNEVKAHMEYDGNQAKKSITLVLLLLKKFWLGIPQQYTQEIDSILKLWAQETIKQSLTNYTLNKIGDTFQTICFWFDTEKLLAKNQSLEQWFDEFERQENTSLNIRTKLKQWATKFVEDYMINVKHNPSPQNELLNVVLEDDLFNYLPKNLLLELAKYIDIGEESERPKTWYEKPNTNQKKEEIFDNKLPTIRQNVFSSSMWKIEHRANIIWNISLSSMGKVEVDGGVQWNISSSWMGKLEIGWWVNGNIDLSSMWKIFVALDVTWNIKSNGTGNIDILGSYFWNRIDVSSGGKVSIGMNQGNVKVSSSGMWNIECDDNKWTIIFTQSSMWKLKILWIDVMSWKKIDGQKLTLEAGKATIEYVWVGKEEVVDNRPSDLEVGRDNIGRNSYIFMQWDYVWWIIKWNVSSWWVTMIWSQISFWGKTIEKRMSQSDIFISESKYANIISKLPKFANNKVNAWNIKVLTYDLAWWWRALYIKKDWWEKIIVNDGSSVKTYINSLSSNENLSTSWSVNFD